MSTLNERVLLHIKFVDDDAAERPLLQGRVSGGSLRVLARTMPGGRVQIALSISARIHRLRASGKVFRYWRNIRGQQWLRTKAGLVVERSFDAIAQKNTTRHLFDDAVLRFSGRHDFDNLLRHSRNVRVLEGPRTGTMPSHELENLIPPILESAQKEAATLLGPLPSSTQRFPLLKEINARGLGVSGHTFFLDATDYRQVAANAFGLTRVRKSLVKEIQRLTDQRAEPQRAWRDRHDDASVLVWFRLFRGLVPIEWIIDSMRQTQAGTATAIRFKPSELVEIRRLLRQVPQPILRRILAEPATQAARVLQDVAMQIGHRDHRVRDVDAVAAVIATKGQRRIRSSRDLEHLVAEMPRIHQLSTRERSRAASANRLTYEESQVYAMEEYNESVAWLDDEDHQVVDWQTWNDPQFQQSARDFIEERRRELMDAQQRREAERQEGLRLEREKQRAAWATATTAVIDGLQIGDLTVIVAGDAQALTLWGNALNNCIAGYSHEIGLDVFAAVVDTTGKVRLNIQITQREGIVQFLGTNNCDAERELGVADARRVLTALIDTGIKVGEYALGIPELAPA